MRSKRYEFPQKVKRAALARSEGRCEARGAVYGLEGGDVRCVAFIGPGNVEYDHWPLPATDEGSGILENCVACCPRCHHYKSANYDTPMQAKGKRIRRANGPADERRKTPHPIRTRKTNWPKGTFQRREPK